MVFRTPDQRTLADSPEPGKPVSYTHLDVYKRQVYSFTASPILSATEVTPCQSPSTAARVEGAASGVAVRQGRDADA